MMQSTMTDAEIHALVEKLATELHARIISSAVRSTDLLSEEDAANADSTPVQAIKTVMTHFTTQVTIKVNELCQLPGIAEATLVGIAKNRVG